MSHLLTLEEALALSTAEVQRLYAHHVNPSLLKVYHILGVADFDAVRAQGMEIELRDGRIILDFSSALGILGLGHHHPRIDAAEAECKRRHVLEAVKVAPQKLQSYAPRLFQPTLRQRVLLESGLTVASTVM